MNCTRVPLERVAPKVNCIVCGRTYSLMQASTLGATADARYRRAQEYAVAHAIDLASAYSVLLGFMRLEDAPSLQEDSAGSAGPSAGGALAKPGPVRAANHGGEGVETYDPGFFEAVAGGYLSLRQAVERGDRVIYASKIAEKNGLSLDLAFLVAENRMTLRQALAQAQAAKLERAQPERSAAPFGARTIAGISLSVLMLGGGLAWWWGDSAGRRSVEIPPPGAALVGRLGAQALAPQAARTSGEIRTNAAGETTAVHGPTPRSVLEAFCASGVRPVRRDFVRVEPSGADWIGYFRQSGALHSIDIRTDPETRGWVAGNGVDPVPMRGATSTSR